jgi:hypothetical protein
MPFHDSLSPICAGGAGNFVPEASRLSLVACGPQPTPEAPALGYSSTCSVPCSVLVKNIDLVSVTVVVRHMFLPSYFMAQKWWFTFRPPSPRSGRVFRTSGARASKLKCHAFLYRTRFRSFFLCNRQASTSFDVRVATKTSSDSDQRNRGLPLPEKAQWLAVHGQQRQEKASCVARTLRQSETMLPAVRRLQVCPTEKTSRGDLD